MTGNRAGTNQRTRHPNGHWPSIPSQSEHPWCFQGPAHPCRSATMIEFIRYYIHNNIKIIICYIMSYVVVACPVPGRQPTGSVLACGIFNLAARSPTTLHHPIDLRCTKITFQAPFVVSSVCDWASPSKSVRDWASPGKSCGVEAMRHWRKHGEQ